jgi:hypothetical protein
MPTYRFRNNDTGEEFDDFISNSRREELLEKNPHISQVPMPFGIVSATGSIDSKTDGGWKEVLGKVSEKHPDSPLADRYGKRSIKEIKTKQVVEKHRHKWRSN